MNRISRGLQSVLRQANARRHGFEGSLPLGSSVSPLTSKVLIGRGFFASGPVWIEAVTSYEGRAFSPLLSIGENVRASPRLHISAVESVTIGDWVLFGENVFIADHQHGQTVGRTAEGPSVPPALRALAGASPVRIEDRCHLGNNSVVLPGTTIGAGSIIGANSVVRGTIPPGVIAVGAPARVVKRWDESSSAWISNSE